MKNLPLLIAILFCLGCKPATKPIAETRYAELLKLYKDIKIDTLKVFTQQNLDSIGYEFRGKKMDTAAMHLLPKEVLQDTASVYAVYKFNLDATRIGLITRTPSEYDASSVKLFIYDKRADKITDQIELSELWGDAGDSFEKTSWLYNDVSKGIKCFTKEDAEHDGSVDDDKDTTITQTQRYYLIGFKNVHHDTVNKDVGFMYEKFKKRE